MEYYVGLDVHSKACSFVIQTAAGTEVGQGEIPTTRAGFERLIGEQALPRGTRVALETGTVAFLVARELTALGLVPHVIDAHEVRLKAYRPRQKCDRRDAHERCEGLRRGSYRTRVHVPPLPGARLRETLSRRRHFVRLQTAEVNAVKRCVVRAGDSSVAVWAPRWDGRSCSRPSRVRATSGRMWRPTVPSGAARARRSARSPNR